MNFLSLDLQFFAGEKTEKATPKKKQDARKKGQVAKSQDVNTAIVLLSVFLFLMFFGKTMTERLIGVLRHSLQNYLFMDLTEKNIELILIEILSELVLFLGPVMMVALIAGVAANYMQVGFMFAPEAIQMKLEKINPISGFKRIFSMRAIVEMLKSILKISFIGVIAFSVLWSRMDEVLLLADKSVGAALATIAGLTLQMGLFTFFKVIFLSLLDYLYQKYDFEKG
ncbi:MAG TPA: flagellar biosynthesis protein FlhB, partial [Bacillus bacterium]|nr:flagellar biosynthesis protein FlhB [Bacillus sp. (in: firmicutes)]